jgi:hypothetical protein
MVRLIPNRTSQLRERCNGITEGARVNIDQKFLLYVVLTPIAVAA